MIVWAALILAVLFGWCLAGAIQLDGAPAVVSAIAAALIAEVAAIIGCMAFCYWHHEQGRG